MLQFEDENVRSRNFIPIQNSLATQFMKMKMIALGILFEFKVH